MHTSSLQALSALLTHARAGTITTPSRTLVVMATSAAAPPPPLPSAPNAATPPSEGEDVIVQAIVVRRDLLSTMEWPVGSVIAQACHACLAVAWEHREDACVADYLASGKINSMHKVIKECKGEAQVCSPRLCMGHLLLMCGAAASAFLVRGRVHSLLRRRCWSWQTYLSLNISLTQIIS